jgi:3',5'-cyclic AMP phosphodiesterase CpdA
MMRILHLSDPHFGAADPLVASAFLAKAEKIAPDVTILSGDLTMRARRHELADAKAFVERLPRPRLVIPGNHDIPALNQPFDRFFAPFKRYRQTFGQNIEPLYTAPGLHVASVNSSKPFGLHADWSVGRLTPEGFHRLDQRLSGAPGTFRVLVLHHPLLAPVGHGRDVVQPLADLVALIVKHRVDLVLCGHFHQSHLATIGEQAGWQCIVSQAPTVCSTRLQGEPQGFHLIRVNEETIEIDRYVHRMDSFESDVIFTFSRTATGWKGADRATRHEASRIA